ncbi:MAG TPA: helix-turn-helix transcriptional regulator [Candidatus Eisenbacteria bacterium]
MVNHLKAFRADRNWSQDQLASRVGVSRQTIHAIERGKSEPSLSLAFRLARLFDVTIEEIFAPEARSDHPTSFPTSST